MIKYFDKNRYHWPGRFLQSIVFVAFTTLTVLSSAQGQALAQSTVNRSNPVVLPAPGTMIFSTAIFSPAIIKGIKINPADPLKFNFLIKPGDRSMTLDQKQEEYAKLIKYFLASLTTPEKDLWVNLSPYEKDRTIAWDFSQTEMGRDMLAQDYILKQLTASLMYPEEPLGKKFWKEIYRQAAEKLGTTEIPVNTFNKVWIVPSKVTVFEKGNVAYIMESRLKVMLDEDYLALQKTGDVVGFSEEQEGGKTQLRPRFSQIIREVILPEIEREVNEGAHFAPLRQMYNSMILSAWFKKRLKQHLLRKVYVDQSKTAGVATDDPKANEQIYQQYLQAFRRGVYNYIKEEPVGSLPLVGKVREGGNTVLRKYFSGGTIFDFSRMETAQTPTAAMKTEIRKVSMDEVSAAMKTLGNVLDGSETTGVDVGSGKDERATRTATVGSKTGDTEVIVSPRGKRKSLNQTGSGFRLGDDVEVVAILEQLKDTLKEKPLSLSQIKQLAAANRQKSHIGQWGVNIPEQVKGIKFLVEAYLKLPAKEFKGKTKTVAAIVSNVMMDLKFDARATGLTIAESERFARVLAEQLRGLKAPKKFQNGSELVEPLIYDAIAKRIERIHKNYSENYKTVSLDVPINSIGETRARIIHSGLGIAQPSAGSSQEGLSPLPINTIGLINTEIPQSGLKIVTSTVERANQAAPQISINSIGPSEQTIPASGINMKRGRTDQQRQQLAELVFRQAYPKITKMSFWDSLLVSDKVAFIVAGAILIGVGGMMGRKWYRDMVAEERSLPAVPRLAYPSGNPNPQYLPYTAPRSQLFQSPDKANKAMIIPANGGIDFNPGYLEMNIKGNSAQISTPKGFEWLLKANIDGFAPQILAIRSGLAISLPFFYGVI